MAEAPPIHDQLDGFGSFRGLQAYELIGYRPDHDYCYVETIRELRRRHPDAGCAIVNH